MMIRLSITAGTGAPTTFEHPGPMVRIGRDPACDLALRGEAGDAVSRLHARIELGADSATLADLGSSNGTLLNGGLLEGPAPLRVGDRVQLGFTGATLTVLALDRSATHPRKARRLPRPVLIGSITAAAIVVVTGAIVFQRPTPGRERTDGAPAAAPPVPIEPPGTDRGEPPPDEHEQGGSGKLEQKPGDENDTVPVPVPDEVPSEKP